MECLQCMERLSEYLDGELDANKYRDIEVHLQCCPDCREVMDDLAALSKEINLSIASIPISTNLTVRIFSAASSEISRPNLSSRPMMSSTMSNESAPRSSIKRASGVTLPASTPSLSTITSFTCSRISINKTSRRGLYHSALAMAHC